MEVGSRTIELLTKASSVGSQQDDVRIRLFVSMREQRDPATDTGISSTSDVQVGLCVCMFVCTLFYICVRGMRTEA